MEFIRRQAVATLPRLPLDAQLDLTYRCNNACRHCWLRLPAGAAEAAAELTFDELRRIVDEARGMGCQAWRISGGEPMLREDFPEILDYVGRKSLSYSLNTNGTLITPDIARLLAGPGRLMVALYGATAGTHDHVTRTPGSFDATMRGFAYLREAAADFIVQVVPMRANYHEFQQMVELAGSLSPHYRCGAPWLWLSACGSDRQNDEIRQQRLDPSEAIVLDEPNHWSELLRKPSDGNHEEHGAGCCGVRPRDDRVFAACIAARRSFHIDPYGRMSFCCFIEDDALRYDLRRGTFREAWEEFIPSLADTVRGGEEFLANCGSCEMSQDCRWCAVFGYLEHGRYSAKVDYLCEAARTYRAHKQEWKTTHLRYYQLAGLTIRLTADFSFAEDTFHQKFEAFRVDEPGEELVSIRLCSLVPSMSDLRLGREIYRRVPWAVHRQRDSWAYLGISDDEEREPYSVSVFNDDHSEGVICHRAHVFERPRLGSLTGYVSDQIVLSRTLAERQACYVHSSAMILGGAGLLFVGHSDAGKSTVLKLLRGRGEILCDDRNIVRRWPDGFRVHGTWSHGELPDVSPAGAPLRAILFLEQAPATELTPLPVDAELVGRMLSHVIKPLVTRDWWEKTIDLGEQLIAEVPAYRLRFDLSGDIAQVLEQV